MSLRAGPVVPDAPTASPWRAGGVRTHHPSTRDTGMAAMDVGRFAADLVAPCANSARPDPGTVEVTLARTRRGPVLQNVNATGTVPLQEPVPVDVGVTRVRPAQGERCVAARRVIADVSVPVEQDGREVRFDPGRLGAHDAVVLDPADP